MQIIPFGSFLIPFSPVYRNPPPLSLCPDGLKNRNYSEEVRQHLFRFAAEVTANPDKKQKEELARAVNLRPTQVCNWFANYRRRQKSRLVRVEELNNSCPERALASHRSEPQDKGSNTPQTAGLSLPNGFRMWSREVKINLKFPQEGKDIACSEQHYVLMDQVDAGGLCFSGVPRCWAPGCHSRGADTANARATAGEKRCLALRRHQMKANTWEAAGLALRFWNKGSVLQENPVFPCPSTDTEPNLSHKEHRGLAAFGRLDLFLCLLE
uniref:Homeobox domain-containing protein n=1 Tax=Zonotrichia albicollis TaxID=44394 RepID=A0A8D2MP69_ZONAL